MGVARGRCTRIAWIAIIESHKTSAAIIMLHKMHIDPDILNTSATSQVRLLCHTLCLLRVSNRRLTYHWALKRHLLAVAKPTSA